MGESYRFAWNAKNVDEISPSYDLIRAEDEQRARAKFFDLWELRQKFWETYNDRLKSSALGGTDWFQILSVDELDPATLTERPAGAHLSIPPRCSGCPENRSLLDLPSLGAASGAG